MRFVPGSGVHVAKENLLYKRTNCTATKLIVMKNLLKKINVFGLGLILAAGTVFVTQSAFTNVNTLEEYGYDFNTSTWYNLNALPPGATFQCSIIDPPTDPVCKQEFDGEPNGTGAIPGSVTEGGYGELIP